MTERPSRPPATDGEKSLLLLGLAALCLALGWVMEFTQGIPYINYQQSPTIILVACGVPAILFMLMSGYLQTKVLRDLAKLRPKIKLIWSDDKEKDDD